MPGLVLPGTGPGDAWVTLASRRAALRRSLSSMVRLRGAMPAARSAARLSRRRLLLSARVDFGRMGAALAGSAFLALATLAARTIFAECSADRGGIHGSAGLATSRNLPAWPAPRIWSSPRPVSRSRALIVSFQIAASRFKSASKYFSRRSGAIDLMLSSDSKAASVPATPR